MLPSRRYSIIRGPIARWFAYVALKPTPCLYRACAIKQMYDKE